MNAIKNLSNRKKKQKAKKAKSFNIRFTPLNIVSAIALVAVITLCLDKTLLLVPKNHAWNNLFIAFSLLIVFVAFLTDQIFRRFVNSIKRIWVIEFALIAFTFALIIFFKITIVR